MLSSIPRPLFVDTVWWYQGPPRKWNYKKPQSTFTDGIPDAGKSTQLVAHATNCAAEGGLILDIMGAVNDSEPLVWGVKGSPYRDSLLVLTGDNVKVNCEFDTMRASEFKSLKQAEDYLVVCTDRALFESAQAQYRAMADLFELCLNRRGWIEHEKGRVGALIIREAWAVAYAQIRAGVSRTEQEAQWKLRELNSNRAHSGIAPLMDSQRDNDVAPAVRTTANFRVIKGFGSQPIPDDFNFLFKPWVLGNDSWRLRAMPPHEFIVVTSWNGVALGVVEKASWNNFKKGTDLIERLGIDVSLVKSVETKSATSILPGVNKADPSIKHARAWELHIQGKNYLEISDIMRGEQYPEISPHTVRAHIKGRCACPARTPGVGYDNGAPIRT